MPDEMSQEEPDALLNAGSSDESVEEPESCLEQATNLGDSTREPRPPPGIQALVDILQLSDRVTQWLVRDVEQWNLVQILTAASDEVGEKILRNVSAQRRADLQWQLERGYSFNPKKVEALCARFAQEVEKWLPDEDEDSDEPAEDIGGLLVRISDLNKRVKGQRQLDWSTIAGLILVLFSLSGGVLLGEALFQPITALIFVLLGVFAAVGLSSCSEGVFAAGRLLAIAFTRRLAPDATWIDYLVHCATVVRTKGILALEMEIESIAHPSLRFWLQLAVDGTEPELIGDIGRTEITGVEARHRAAQDLVMAAGFGALFAGLFGLGLGLILVPEIQAVRGLILPGCGGLVGGLFLALRCRIQDRSACEIRQRRLMLEGITAVQQGDHPHLVRQRLEAFVSSSFPGESSEFQQDPGQYGDALQEKASAVRATADEEDIPVEKRGMEDRPPPILSQEELDALLMATDSSVGAEEESRLSSGKEEEIDPLEMEMLKMIEEEEKEKEKAFVIG